MTAAHVTGVGVTPFGRLPGPDSLGWQERAAELALGDAGLSPDEVDVVIAGYSAAASHLMPANVFAESFGVRPKAAFGMSVGGATGLSMVMNACAWIESGRARHVLVVAGENRASGMARRAATAVLAEVGHPTYEVPLGGTVPAYYALLASRYLSTYGLQPAELAPFAVLMREHARHKDGAQFQDPITEADVLASRPVSEPLRLLDCCPVSDGGAAVVVSATPGDRSITVAGAGQAHLHQHLSELDPNETGGGLAARRAFAEAGAEPGEMAVFGIYDSFTITVAMLVEELGLAAPGRAGVETRAGRFAVDGAHPLNTHGGLLSYGHCGVGGGLAHLGEVVTQLRGERGDLQVPDCASGYVHGDGGVFSAHVGLVLRRQG